MAAELKKEFQLKVAFVDPRVLKLHPGSAEIYGSELDPDVAQSIRERGIRSPLLVSADMTVVSGNRRLLMALELGLDQVPVNVDSSLTDPDDILEAVIDCNRATELSVAAKLKIAIKVKEIEGRRAEKRIQATQFKKVEDSAENTAPANLAGAAEAGETSSKVAKKLDVGQRTAARAIQAGEALVRAEQAGNQELAERIKEAKSIHAAARIAKEVCSDGGPHDFDDEACRKCHEPKPKKRTKKVKAPITAPIANDRKPVNVDRKANPAVKKLLDKVNSNVITLIKGFDDVADKLGELKCSHYQQLVKLMGDVYEEWKSWMTT